MCAMNEMVENSEKNPSPEMTNEEKKKMLEDFFADMNKKYPRKSDSMK